MSRRWLAVGLAVGLSVVALLGARSYPVDNVAEAGSHRETLLGYFAIDESGGNTINVNRCARPWNLVTGTDLACTNTIMERILGSPAVITRVTINTQGTTFTGTAACDVRVLVGATTSGGSVPSGWTSNFLMGSSTVGRTARSSDQRTGLNITVTAGQAVYAQHIAPTSDYCVNAMSCACNGANGSYILYVYGYFTN